MGLIRSLVKFVTDPKPVTRLSDLEPGRAIVDGVVRSSDQGLIPSPVKGQPCVAFYYKAFHVVGTRSGQPMPMKLKVAEVYSPFVLELPDGKIKATPRKSDPFSATDHKELGGAGYQGFRATEDLVQVGTYVRAWGVVRKDGDSWEMTFSTLERVPPPSLSDAEKKKRKRKAKGKKP